MHTILICDDDRDIVSALKIYLTSEGYQTVEAYNGEEAVAAVRGGNIDLILMDVHIAKPIDAELLKKKIAEYCR